MCRGFFFKFAVIGFEHWFEHCHEGIIRQGCLAAGERLVEHHRLHTSRPRGDCRVQAATGEEDDSTHGTHVVRLLHQRHLDDDTVVDVLRALELDLDDVQRLVGIFRAHEAIHAALE